MSEREHLFRVDHGEEESPQGDRCVNTYLLILLNTYLLFIDMDLLRIAANACLAFMNKYVAFIHKYVYFRQ